MQLPQLLQVQSPYYPMLDGFCAAYCFEKDHKVAHTHEVGCLSQVTAMLPQVSVNRASRMGSSRWRDHLLPA